jgi:hypothetical protein
MKLFSIGQQVVLHMFIYWGCGLYDFSRILLIDLLLTVEIDTWKL